MRSKCTSIQVQKTFLPTSVLVEFKGKTSLSSPPEYRFHLFLPLHASNTTSTDIASSFSSTSAHSASNAPSTAKTRFLHDIKHNRCCGNDGTVDMNPVFIVRLVAPYRHLAGMNPDRLSDGLILAEPKTLLPLVLAHTHRNLFAINRSKTGPRWVQRGSRGCPLPGLPLLSHPIALKRSRNVRIRYRSRLVASPLPAHASVVSSGPISGENDLLRMPFFHPFLPFSTPRTHRISSNIADMPSQTSFSSIYSHRTALTCV